MNASASLSPASPDSQKKEDFPASLNKLQQLLENKVNILQAPTTEDQQAVLLGEGAGGEGPRSFAALSQELTLHLQQLQKQTQQELSNIQTQLVHIEGRRRLLSSELLRLQEKKKLTERELKTSSCRQTSTVQLCVIQKFQASVGERLVQSQRLVFQEKALSALQELLSQDLRQYQELIQSLSRFTQEVLRSDGEETFTERLSDQSMQEKSDTELERSMKSTRNGEESQTFQASYREPTAGSSQNSYLQRAQSIKDLISKFSTPALSRSSSSSRFGLMLKSLSVEVLTDAVDGPKSKPVPSALSSSKEDPSPAPSVTLLPPSKKTSESEAEPVPKSPKGSQITARIDCPVEISTEKLKSQPQSKSQPAESSSDSVEDSGMGSESEFDSNKQLDSPSEEEPSTPKAGPTIQNPKYQLFLNNEMKTNGLSGGGGGGGGGDGPGGGGSMAENGMKRWETNRLGVNSYKGSLESLASRDWDNAPDKFAYESPPRVFNSPYATATSMEYNPVHRMSEFKVHSGLSPATSEMNLYSFNSRSTSPVPIPTLNVPTPTLGSARPRFSAYDSLVRRRSEINTIGPQVVTNHYTMRSNPMGGPNTMGGSNTMGGPNRKNYIEELTKELDSCQKRNQFLEAESVEMEKERNQIRFEMRGLLVNNEDLLRTNTQLSNEMKRMREQMIEMDRENQAMAERCREMEIEVKGARDMMVEANTQEYAFNVLQQSLQNKIQDAEENLEKQTQHAKSLAEKLWLAERQLEELEVDKDTKTKRTSELHNDILRLETELSDALQASSQASTELSLQQKLRADAQMRVDELEETLLEKDQELQRLQVLVSRLQGEVSGKLIDKERTLEEEIQLRERLQLQCKQAERTVDDLTMELQTTNQARDDLAKQLKLAQEKMIDMETDLEELHDSEQRWAAKQKRAIEQTEQLQLKLIQEKELNDHLDIEKTSMERQLRELRLEVDELQSSRVQEDVVSRAESRAKELESFLRAEERNKITLTNTISKLERRINELSDQMEEEHRIATEQKDLMTQRIRSLKRQLNEAEEEASRKEAQYRHTHRELTEERETSSRLQRQLLDQHLQNKRVDTMTIRQTLDNLRLDLSVDEEEEQQQAEAAQREQAEPAERAEPESTVTKV